MMTSPFSLAPHSLPITTNSYFRTFNIRQDRVMRCHQIRCAFYTVERKVIYKGDQSQLCNVDVEYMQPYLQMKRTMEKRYIDYFH